MRNFILLLLFSISTQLQAQNNDYLVTMEGIGMLKLEMKKAEVEKMLNKKFTLKNSTEKEGAWMDTVQTKYKNTDITLYFERLYEDDNKFDMVLAGLLAKGPLFKTKTGIGLGADKLKIITTYEMNRISVMPDYEDEEYTRLSKTLSTIYVYNDNSDSVIAFHLKNKKVVSIEVARFAGD